MDKLLLVLGAIAVAGTVSALVSGRRVSKPNLRTHHIPTHLRPAEFGATNGELLVVVFSSSTCKTCAKVIQTLESLDHPDLIAVDMAIEEHPDVHERYEIDGVPTTVVTDASGTVRSSFLGPVRAAQLEDALTSARTDPSGNV